MRLPKFYPPVLGVVTVLYSIPSLAMFVLLIDITGVTETTVFIPLALYSLAILVPGVVDALRSVPREVIDAANGMGYGRMRRYLTVELPIALPTLVASIRVAAVSTISMMSIGGLIGNYGGLGDLITLGHTFFYTRLIWLGLVSLLVLAVLCDLLLRLAQRLLDPVGPAAPERGVNLFSDLQTFFEHFGYHGPWTRVIEHCEYSLLALAIAAAIALPLSILSGHYGRGDGSISVVAVVGRAMPSLGLLVILAVKLGPLNPLVAMVPLVLLGMPPILLYTHAGIRAVDPAAVDAARGLGMTSLQTIRLVELPAALPLILAGLRSAAVQIVATATLAAITSFGGLGRYIIDGLAEYDYAQVVGGAVLVALVSLATLAVFWLLDRLLVSPGLRTR